MSRKTVRKGRVKQRKEEDGEKEGRKSAEMV